MLKAMELPLPRHLNVHGYWNVDARKVSKSLGNMISPRLLRDRYGFEQARYFLLREMSFGNDANFSEAALVERVNADLANNLGNLLSRTLNLVEKHCASQVPEPGAAGQAEETRHEAFAVAAVNVEEAMESLRFHDALAAIVEFSGAVNRYVDGHAPWKAAKAEGGEVAVRTCLYWACESLRQLALLLGPFLPGTAAEIERRLGVASQTSWEDRRRAIEPGTRTHEGNAALPAPRAARGRVMWIDSHCHVTADEFASDRAEVIERASAAGIETLIAIGAGYGVAANARAVELAARDPRVYATVGVHPHDAAQLDDAGKAALREWLRAPRVVAVGECGLDYWYEHSPRAAQREAFAWHVALARELRLPVSIHVRDRGDDAYRELLDIWSAEGRGEVEGVLHCYTHDLAFARRALEQNLYLSFSGILTFKRDRGLRAVAAALPLERLLVETDAPLLAPEGLRGRRNEPVHVARVGEALAQARGVAPEVVAAATAANARALFRIPA